MAGVINIDDFSGGLNTRDSPNQVKPNETPGPTVNATLDERGAWRWRKGCTNLAVLPGTSPRPGFLFFSVALNLWLVVRYDLGVDFARLWSRPADLSGSWTAIGQIGDTGIESPGIAFVDFPGNPPRVVIVYSGGTSVGATIHHYDGTTLATASATLGGIAAAVWQNRVWAAGFPLNNSTSQKTRLMFSALGDATSWPAANFNDIRDLDASPLTGLGVVGSSLLVFKRTSAYRVTDPNTGNYTTIDPSSGCISSRAVVPFRGRLYTWGVDGIYEWDGIGPGVLVADQVRPVFIDVADNAVSPGVCGGVHEDKVVFAYPSDLDARNDLLLEYDPDTKSVMLHQLASQGQDDISSFAQKDEFLHAAIQDGNDLFRMFNATPGLDDGELFNATYSLPWLLPNGGKVARVNRIQVEGFTKPTGANLALHLTVDRDFDPTVGIITDVSRNIGSDLVAAADEAQRVATLFDFGHAQSFAPRFLATEGASTGEVAVRAVRLYTEELAR